MEYQGMVTKGIAVLHNNSHLHTVQTFWHINFKVLEHPLLSPDLVRWDYHLLVPLKDTSRG